MKFKYDDGGRKAAGWKGKNAADCVPRAISIATGKNYRDIRSDLDALTTKMTGGLQTTTNNGTPNPVSYRYLDLTGWELVLTKGQYLKDIPRNGIYIACIPRHMVTVINGIAHDTWDSTKSRRTKCGSPKLEGYYRKVA